MKAHSPRVAPWLAACTLCATLTASAQAATVVTGRDTTTQAFEILPDADPLTHNIDIGQARAIAYIKRMPATRTVVRVTLGDLARASSCTQNVGVRLYVDEYEADDWPNGYIRRIQSTGNPTLTDTHSDLVFTIPATTFSEGRLYFFYVQTVSTSVCRTASLRTWAHNSPTVGPGVDRCQQIPENGTLAWRMWHETGSTDAVPCPDAKPIPSNFDPSMPTGWLLVRSLGPSTSVVITPTDVGRPPGDPASCGNLSPNTGIVHERWRDHPSSPGDSEYVCRFTQFESPNELLPTPDGWYHGGPWNIPGRTGAPRDVHLRLETIDYDGLVRKFRPKLKFDSLGNYWNASAATLTDHWENTLERRAPQTTLFQHSGPGMLNWGLEHLVASPDEYPDGQGAPYEGDFIDAVGDNKTAADAFRPGPYDNIAYAHVIHDESGKLWIQYWFFYYFNEQNFVGEGDHEGDWEMVQYGLTEGGLPDVATYAQHKDDEAESCSWNQVLTETVADPITGPRQAPLVYVAAASQASYFVGGQHVRNNAPDDMARGNGDAREPTLGTIGDDFPAWVSWPGRWGSHDGLITKSPQSPAKQGNRWSTPDDFNTHAGFCSNPDGTPR